MLGKTISELTPGQKASFSKTVTETDVYLYAGITGDFNPAHIDEVYASQTGFKTRISHGMLLGGFISNVLGNRLPGPGTIYIQQSLSFKAPVCIGDTITALVEVIEINPDKKRVRLKTTCFNQKQETVLDGEAVVSPPRPPKTG